MKILSNYELKDMGQPIKETDCWLFFEKGKIALSIMPKVDKPIRQVSNVYQFPIHQYYNQKRRVK